MAGLDLIYHGGWANEDDLDIVEGRDPDCVRLDLAVARGRAQRSGGFGDRVRDRLRAQLDTSFRMIRADGTRQAE
jgi:hypothetical protein